MKDEPKNEIIKALEEAEKKYGLKLGTLNAIYDEEARVVFMGKRRNIFTNLRKILDDAKVPISLGDNLDDNSEN